MTTTINASTSSGLVVTPDNSGNVVLQYNGVSTPAFSAYLSANQTLTSGAWGKITFDTEEFDTASCFNNSSTYRFTPTVAGYYQTNLCVSGIGSQGQAVYASVYKNGSNVKENGFYATGSTTIDDFAATVACLIYMNGTTDYLEFYAYVIGGSPFIYGGQQKTYVSSCLLRGA